jgi:hypothetical protein
MESQSPLHTIRFLSNCTCGSRRPYTRRWSDRPTTTLMWLSGGIGSSVV